MNEVSVTITSVDKTSAGFKAAQQGAEKVEDSFKDLSQAADGVSRASDEVSSSSKKAGASLSGLDQDIDHLSSSASKGSSSLGSMSDGLGSVEKTTAHEKLGRVAEKADSLDSSGARATGSLGAMASGFELVGNTKAAETIQGAAMATDFFAGVGQGAALVAEKMGKAIAAIGTGPFVLGILGAAAAVAAIVIAFNAMGSEARKAAQHQKEITEAANELIDTLDEENGAITENSREWAYNRLVQKGLLSELESMDANIRDVVDAMLGNKTAISQVSAELEKHKQKLLDDAAARGGSTEAMHNQQVATETLINEIGNGSEQVDLAKKRWNEHEDAVRDDTDATEDEISALQDLANELKKQTDPLYAFIDAQRTLKQAQDDYSEAVKKSGKNSSDAKQKLEDLGKAAVDLSIKAGEAGDSFDGHFSPAAKRMLASAGLTKDEIARLETELRKAKAAADKLDGTNAKVTVTTEYKTIGSGPNKAGYAHGGITGAASGRLLGSGMTLVGENGPELLDLPPGTNVNSNPDTMRMMASGHSSGITVNIYAQGSILSERDLVKIIRDEFVNGGFRGALSAA